MSTTTAKIVASTAAMFLLTGLAVAQSLPEVQVQAKRMITTKAVGRTSSGVPITDVSVSYTVNARDIDISTNSGAQVLEQRVKDAAAAACKEISRQFPDATPSDRECTSMAAGRAMSQVHELIAAAEKNRAK